LLRPDQIQEKEHTVARMTFGSALVVAALAASSSVQAQQVRPEDSLNQAMQLVSQLTPPPSGGERIAVLKQDFTDFASAYLAASAAPATATPGAVGTSGRADARPDWRAKYQRVEADLAALLGPAGGSAASGPAALDPETRARLESVRTRLQIFYAGTLSQPDGNPVAHTGAPQTGAIDAPAAPRAPVAPTAQAPQTLRSDSAAAAGTGAAPSVNGAVAQVDTPFGTALALLDRMQRILDDAIKNPDKISLDRGAIDEMRAEIAQIRTMLQASRKN
jgi:hypothetical protein